MRVYLKDDDLMKLSKVLHVSSVALGLVGVGSFLVAVFGSAEQVFGVTKMDTLACVAILMLMAIWAAVGTIHHVMLEKRGEII